MALNRFLLLVAVFVVIWPYLVYWWISRHIGLE